MARIHPYSDSSVGQCVTRWTDNNHCDPVYDVVILVPHPALAGLRPSWV
jgi:hypothetical protein